MADLIGTTIGNYRIESLLGTGGMGQVYLGVHLHLNRPAAIKIMHAHLAGEVSFQRRFRQEARAVAALNHPNIVQTWDFGVQDGNYYLVMELLTDGSLRSLIGSETAQQPGWAVHVGLDLVRQVSEGLAYAHNRGMVHRDIKPDNLMLCRNSDQYDDDAPHDLQVKITDFGLARLTEEASATGPSVVMGTPAFMSPELCQGLPLDGRSDVYSLGVVLFQVVTGRLPFETRAAAEAAYRHVHETPPSPREYWPEIPASLEEIILRCLAKDPSERPTSSELVRALRETQHELAAIAPIPPTPPHGVGSYQTPSPLPSGRPMPTPSSAPIAHVAVTSGTGGTRQVVELNLDGLVVGSLPDNDLVLGDEGVYGRHLRIDWDGEQAYVTDLGSGGGTMLNGEPLTPHRSESWGSDDELQVGGRTLRLMVPAAVTPVPVGAPVAAVVTPADDATMSVNRHELTAAPASRSRFGRLPVVAAAAVVAILLSIGGMQALSSGGDSDSNGDETASLVIAAEPTETTSTTLEGAGDPTATVALTETPVAKPTQTATPTPTAAQTATAEPTQTPEPTATEPPPPPPPPPTSTPVPPTATSVPPTATPEPPATETPAPPEPTPPPEETPAPEATVPTEPTAPEEEPPASEPTSQPGDEPEPEPTTQP